MSQRSFYVRFSNARLTSTKEMKELLKELTQYLSVDLPGKASKYINTIGYTAEESARILGVAPSTVRDKRSILSRKAYNALGDDFFTLVENNDLRGVSERIAMVLDNVTSADLILTEVVSQITKTVSKVPKGVRIEDCADEIKVLKQYSYATVNEQLGNVDPDKLAYVIAVLDSDASPKDKPNLVNFLKK